MLTIPDSALRASIMLEYAVFEFRLDQTVKIGSHYLLLVDKFGKDYQEISSSSYLVTEEIGIITTCSPGRGAVSLG